MRPQAEPRAREVLLSAVASGLVCALLLFEPLFLGRCTLAFGPSDPRIDVRPWARPSPPPLPAINPLTPDLDAFVLPGLMRMRRLAAAGEGTDWDDAQLLGYPLAANLPFPRFSPLARLVDPLPPVQALDVLLFLHLWIGAWLAYLLGRRGGLPPPAAALAAVGFAGSAWMGTHWHLAPILWTSALWPLQLHALLSLARGRRRRGAVEAAVGTALLGVAGFPQVALLLTLAAALLALASPPLRRRATLLGLLAAMGCGLLLAAPQLLRSFDAFSRSLRATDAVRHETAARGLPPGALVGLLLPEAFGRPSAYASDDPPAPSFEEHPLVRRLLGDPLQNNPVENALYPGMLVLLLLAAAAGRFAGPGGRDALLLLAAGAAAVLVALAAPWVVRALPAFERFAAGNVKRVLAVPAGLWPFAAAFAYQALLRGRARLPRKTLLLLFASLLAAPPLLAAGLEEGVAERLRADLWRHVARQAAFLAAGAVALWGAKRAPRRFAWAPVLVLIVDLGLFARAFNPFPVEEPPYPETQAVAALRAVPGRVVVFGTGPNLLPAPAAAVHGIRSVQGMVPMVPRRAAELLACIEGPLFDPRDPRVARPLARVESLTHPLLDLLGVDTVVHADPALAAKTGLEERFASREERIGALRRSTALPRAFLVTGAEVVPDAGERLRRLADPAFDPRRVVLLEQEPGVPLPRRGRRLPVVEARHRVSEHVVRTDAAEPALLVLGEGFDPGWRAKLDGAPAKVLVADHALMAVALPAGRHVVRFRYRSRAARPGAALALAGAVALAWTLFLLGKTSGLR